MKQTRRIIEQVITGSNQPDLPVQALAMNQRILPGVMEGNRFLEVRAKLQSCYLDEIEIRFDGLVKTRLPILDHDDPDLSSLRQVGEVFYG